MTEIFLVRHPESLNNIDETIVGGRTNEVDITSRGEEQARRFATSFQRGFPQPTVLYSSPAVRTRKLMDTYVQVTGNQDGYIVDDALQELSNGTAEGQLRSAIYSPDVIALIQQQLHDFKQTEGESLNELADRVLDWVWRAHQAHPDGVVLAATHGQATRTLVGRLLGWSHYETTRDLSKRIPNVGLTHLSVDDTEIHVRSYGKTIIQPVDLPDEGVY